MPKLNEIIKERESKKFIKKSYRPWDLTGDGSISANEANNTSSVNGTSLLLPPVKTSTVINISEKDALDNEKSTLIDNNSVSNEKQLGNKPVTNEEHIDHKQETNQKTIKQQLDINVDPTTCYNQLIKLSGIQKNILNFIIDICLLRKGLETGPIETSTIAMCVKTTVGSVKISIKRLIDKGFIIRNKGKQAKGGYINLSIEKDVLDNVIQQRQSNSRLLNPEEILNHIRYQIDNNQVYNNSSNILNNTTIKKQEFLSEEWSNINYESLSHIGFTKTQIKQLIEKNEPTIVQESINHFAFGLENNPKFQKYEDPLNVLMGVLRKGQGWFEKDYRTPKEIAQQHLLEAKKAEIKRKRELDENIYKIAMMEWQQSLTEADIENIAPRKKVSGDIIPVSAKLSLYFKDNIWPNKKVEYLV